MTDPAPTPAASTPEPAHSGATDAGEPAAGAPAAGTSHAGTSHAGTSHAGTSHAGAPEAGTERAAVAGGRQAQLDHTGLRPGWTTGACATAAATSAYTALLTGDFPDPVTITLPKGQTHPFALTPAGIGARGHGQRVP